LLLWRIGSYSVREFSARLATLLNAAHRNANQLCEPANLRVGEGPLAGYGLDELVLSDGADVVSLRY
jgi:hypothetical protein